MNETSKFRGKSKSDIKSDFNMGASYLQFLCDDVMTEVARRSVGAKDKPRVSTVKQYYSIVRELYNQAEAVWTGNESMAVNNMLDKIEEELTTPKNLTTLIHKIETVQRLIYNLIRQYNMLIPITVSKDSREEKTRMLRGAFGLHGRTDEDNEGSVEEW